MENRIVYRGSSVIEWFNDQAEPYRREGEDGKNVEEGRYINSSKGYNYSTYENISVSCSAVMLSIDEALGSSRSSSMASIYTQKYL